jgi:hypothetical protein
VFNALVNGDARCVSFIKINLEEIGIDNIELLTGPFGYSNLGDCILCVPTQSPTPTPTVTPTQTVTPTITPTPSITPTLTPTPESSPSQTPTMTPTATPTPTMTPQPNYYVYRDCSNPNNWLVQTSVGGTTTPGEVQKDNDEICWEFQYISQGIPNLGPVNVITFNGNYFTVSTVYSNCDECGVVVVDEQTEINIFFDNSGSMNTTFVPLNTMKNTILKTCLLPFYNNDSDLYDQRVKVLNMNQTTIGGVNCDERGFRCLATTGTTTNITKVINLVFQDEGNNVYYNIFVPSWTITTPRRPGFDLDMGYLRNTLINNQSTPNYLKGIFFRVATLGSQSDTLRALLVAVKDGNGNYSGTNGLSDRNEITYELDVIPSSTPQYYANVIVNSLNSLGYNIPQC